MCTFAGTSVTTSVSFAITVGVVVTFIFTPMDS
ncbi:MAG: hypothetical protein BWY76_02914 [bacterium ADurb.Bin429]|nr:MAG: hypothetical protein BWY76_02914 [bacterium ADurb.Bin429]